MATGGFFEAHCGGAPFNTRAPSGVGVHTLQKYAQFVIPQNRIC